VVIETHDGVENRVLSEERIQKIMKDTTSGNGGFLDLGETDGGMFVLNVVLLRYLLDVFHVLTALPFSLRRKLGRLF